MEQIRNAEIYGVRPKRTFREAATKYLNEATKSEHCRRRLASQVIGLVHRGFDFGSIHMGTLQPFIQHRQGPRCQESDDQLAIQTVRHILNMAASEWLDESGKTWMEHAPRFKFLT